MPYPADHKPRIRERIVDAASRLVRERGIDRASVSSTMKAAGLTHGGFYTHFDDKDALVKAAIDRAFDESERWLFGGSLGALEGDAWVAAASARYLRLGHRDAPAEGCAIPALGGEVTRARPDVRARFAERSEAIVAQMARRLDGDRARAIRLLTTWSGALLMARVAPSADAAEEILAAAREAR